MRYRSDAYHSTAFPGLLLRTAAVHGGIMPPPPSSQTVTDTITSGSGRFTTREYGGRIAVDFSTRLSSPLFARYNNGADRMTVNSRLRHMPRTGSNPHPVCNHLFDVENRFRTPQKYGYIQTELYISAEIDFFCYSFFFEKSLDKASVEYISLHCCK